MSALAIAHKKLDGDLNNSYDYRMGDKFLYLCSDGDYITLMGKRECQEPTYISTVEEFNNFKGDNMKTAMDWSKAPEGATHLLERLGVKEFGRLVGYEYQEIDDEDVTFIVGGAPDDYKVISEKPMFINCTPNNACCYCGNITWKNG